MTLQELESKLGYLRKEKQLKLSFPQNVSPLQNITYDNIENHKNYNITTLMLYINALGFALSVNDETVTDLEQFGKILVAIRNEIGLSQLGNFDKNIPNPITYF